MIEVRSTSTPDAPLDPSWPNPDIALVSRIEGAQGMISERFAFCQTMPLGDFLAAALALRKSGYRPIRFRPYADGETVRASAVWTRDRRKWRSAAGLSSLQIRQQDEQNKKDGFLPVDVAGYIAAEKDGKPTERYAALWVEKSADDDARMYVGATALKQDEVQNEFKKAQLIPRIQTVMAGSEGPMRYCGVWGRPPGPAVTGRTYQDQFEGDFEQAQAEMSDQLLLDLVAFTEVTKPGHPNRRCASAWNSDASFEATAIHGVDPSDHLRKCQERVAQGYRPVSWSASRTAADGSLVTASVWHRPVITEETRDGLAERQARAAIALVRLGKAEGVWPLLRHSADPRLRSFIVTWLHLLGADPRPIVAELERIDSGAKPTPAHGQQLMDAVLFQAETSTQRALILALGAWGIEGLSSGEKERLTVKLLDLYRNEPDSGIHGAADWTLRQWKQQGKLKELDAELMKLKERGKRRWYVNNQWQTFAVIDGPVEFRMGSPSTEPTRNATTETPRRQVIPRRFAIASKEVTIEQWQRFERANPQLGLPPSFVNQYSPDPDGPMIGFSWYVAAHYCNWLSEQEGLPKDQWCYLPNEAGAYAEGMSASADILERIGYRLPTEAEWEYACRAGAVTSRHYGQSIDILYAYARYQNNSNDHTWRCGSSRPNDLGLFDMLGNEYEWIHDSVGRLMPQRSGRFSDIISANESIKGYPRRLRGGAFHCGAPDLRSAIRSKLDPSSRDASVGCRPARTYR